MRRTLFVVQFFVFVFCLSGLLSPAFVEGQASWQPPGGGGGAALDMESLRRDAAGALALMDEAFRPSPIEMTLEDEYFLGRAVAAEILKVFGAYTANPALTAYLNKICLAITINSPKPTLFSGYWVEILDSDGIYAFATSGGHIFISRGLIDIAPSEDALAAVIAHEVAHIQLRHMASIMAEEHTVQQLRAVSERAATIAARHLTEEERAALFQTSLTASIRTLFRDGYSREQEFEADQMARILLINAGYNPAALEEMLRILGQRHRPGNLSSTHPSPAMRIANLQRVPVPATLRGHIGPETITARASRFNAILGR